MDDGYRKGELERIALATANSDLRSDLLAAQQKIERLRSAGDELAVAYRRLGGLEAAHDTQLRTWEGISSGT